MSSCCWHVASLGLLHASSPVLQYGGKCHTSDAECWTPLWMFAGEQLLPLLRLVLSVLPVHTPQELKSTYAWVQCCPGLSSLYIIFFILYFSHTTLSPILTKIIRNSFFNRVCIHICTLSMPISMWPTVRTLSKL